MRVIGTIRTAHRAGEDTPVQAALNPDEEGTIELDHRYADGLDGLDGFSHLWLLTWLAPHDAEPPDPDLRQVPYLLGSEGRERGIFATRGPRRPNPIGLSLVRLIAIDDATIRFAGVDQVDGTALLDIKPYVVRFDQPDHPVHSGWFDTITYQGPVTPSTLRSPRQDER
jgi:tRNA (adenine37-N6)-methyltransferase